MKQLARSGSIREEETEDQGRKWWSPAIRWRLTATTWRRTVTDGGGWWMGVRGYSRQGGENEESGPAPHQLPLGHEDQ